MDTFRGKVKAVVQSVLDGIMTPDDAADQITDEVRSRVGEPETTDQGFPTQWKGEAGKKKLWINARNHLRRSILNKL